MNSIMWIVVLLVLALLAYLVVQALMNKSGGSTASYEGDNPASGAAASRSPAENQHSLATTEAGTSAGAAAAGAAVAAGAASMASGAGSAVANSAGAVAQSGQAAAGALTAGAIPTTSYAVNTNDAAHDVREMIKILNLRASDASRLGIEKDQFEQLKSAASGMSDNIINDVAGKLRGMLN